MSTKKKTSTKKPSAARKAPPVPAKASAPAVEPPADWSPLSQSEARSQMLRLRDAGIRVAEAEIEGGPVRPREERQWVAHGFAEVICRAITDSVREHPLDAAAISATRLAATDFFYLPAKTASDAFSQECYGHASLFSAYRLAVEANAARVNGALPRALSLYQEAEEDLAAAAREFRKARRAVRYLPAAHFDGSASLTKTKIGVDYFGWKLEVLGFGVSVYRSARDFPRAITILRAAERTLQGLEAAMRSVAAATAEELAAIGTVLAKQRPRLAMLRGLLLGTMGDLEGARACAIDVAGMQLQDPFLAAVAAVNNVDARSKAGDIAAAEGLLPAATETVKKHGGPVLIARLRGIMGRIQRDPVLMEESLGWLLEAGATYDAALVGLEAAVLRAEGGEYHRCVELAGVLAQVFFTAGVDREALAAVALYRSLTDSLLAVSSALQPGIVSGIRAILVDLEKHRSIPGM